MGADKSDETICFYWAHFLLFQAWKWAGKTSSPWQATSTHNSGVYRTRL